VNVSRRIACALRQCTHEHGLSPNECHGNIVTKRSHGRFLACRPLALPQGSPEPSRDMPGAHTTLCCVRPAEMPVCAARRSEMPGSCRSWHVHGTTMSVATIHHKSAPLGRSDQLSCLCGVASIYTTGPSPVVHPYSTCLSPIWWVCTVERDCSVMTGRP
jgi:hypothetical protein